MFCATKIGHGWGTQLQIDASGISNQKTKKLKLHASCEEGHWAYIRTYHNQVDMTKKQHATRRQSNGRIVKCIFIVLKRTRQPDKFYQCSPFLMILSSLIQYIWAHNLLYKFYLSKKIAYISNRINKCHAMSKIN